MAKYADITPFYEWLEDLMRLDTSNYPDHKTLMFYEIMDELDSLTEMVRCKDCMWSRPKDHREPTDTPMELICQCFKHHHIPAPWGARMAVNPDDFCSYGERRKNG